MRTNFDKINGEKENEQTSILPKFSEKIRLFCLYSKKQNTRELGKNGFVQIIIIIVIIVLILSYFNVDIESFIERPIVQKNIQTVWQWTLWLWENVLRTPTFYVWDFLLETVFQRVEVSLPLDQG